MKGALPAFERPRLTAVSGIAEWCRHMLVPIREGFEPSDVRDPLDLARRVDSEVVPLFPKRVLLAVRAVERVDVREEFLGVRLLNFPRWIAYDRVKARILR